MLKCITKLFARPTTPPGRKARLALESLDRRDMPSISWAGTGMLGITGTIQVADGAMSGTFDVADAAGTAAVGSYVCAAGPVTTPTTMPVTGGGEEVPGSDAPPSS